VTTLAVGIIDEQVEEYDRFEQQFVFRREVEVVIVGVVFDELLERARAVGTVFTQSSEWDDVKAERLADDVRGDLAQGKGVLFEIPERLLPARGFIHSGIDLILISDFNQEGVVRTERELTFDLKVAVLEDGLQGMGYHVSSSLSE